MCVCVCYIPSPLMKGSILYMYNICYICIFCILHIRYCMCAQVYLQDKFTDTEILMSFARPPFVETVRVSPAVLCESFPHGRTQSALLSFWNFANLMKNIISLYQVEPHETAIYVGQKWQALSDFIWFSLIALFYVFLKSETEYLLICFNDCLYFSLF